MRRFFLAGSRAAYPTLAETTGGRTNGAQSGMSKVAKRFSEKYS